MKKALFLLLCFTLVVFTVILVSPSKKKSITAKKEAPRLFASTQPNVGNSAARVKKFLAAPGRQTYSISTTHHSPDFYKAIIDPEDVKVGQSQTMTVYVKDEKAPITEVTAEIQTDKETIKYPLTRISGTDRDGVWESSWTVHDTHDFTYVTTFKAKNSIGETGEARLSWTDPGCGCNGTNCTISTTCTVSGDEGANGGTLTITGSVTVPNATYLTYGTTFSVSGTLSVNSGGVIKSGSICGGVSAGVACTGTDYCSGSTRYYNWQCNGSGSCAVVSSQACAAHGTCQTGGGCSAGSCVSVSNAGAGTDPNNECTASYNSCSGANRIGPDGNCNGAGACDTGGLSNACATSSGTCTTGGGCSAGNCINPYTANGSTGPGCTATHYVCDGAGTCYAPTTPTCINSASKCSGACTTAGYAGCNFTNNLTYCTGGNVACTLAGASCNCWNYTY